MRIATRDINFQYDEKKSHTQLNIYIELKLFVTMKNKEKEKERSKQICFKLFHMFNMFISNIQEIVRVLFRSLHS